MKYLFLVLVWNLRIVWTKEHVFWLVMAVIPPADWVKFRGTSWVTCNLNFRSVSVSALVRWIKSCWVGLGSNAFTCNFLHCWYSCLFRDNVYSKYKDFTFHKFPSETTSREKTTSCTASTMKSFQSCLWSCPLLCAKY